MKYFITAIDTDAGKTVVTGLWARYLSDRGVKVITQKIAQTGCEGIADDILKHRELMGIDLQDCDKSGLTCPYLFKFPASPHLSSAMESKEIDPNKIMESANELEQKYDVVLMEGVGGLMVPLTQNYLVVDFIKDNNLECVLVSSSKLGSINHTLLTLEVLKSKSINVKALVYNQLPDADHKINQSTKKYLESYLNRNFEGILFVEIPILNSTSTNVDFKNLGC